MIRRIVIAGMIMFLFQSCISSPPIIDVDPLDITKLNNLLVEGIEDGKTSDYTKALAKFEKGLELAVKSDNKQMIKKYQHNICMVYNSEGIEAGKALNYPKALARFKKGMELAKKTGNKQKQMVGTFLRNIGGVYYSIQQNKKAAKYFEQSLTIARETGDRESEGVNLDNIGSIYINLKQFEKALEYYKHAISIYRETSNQSENQRDGEISSVSELRTRSYLNIMGRTLPELPETEEEAREIMAILNAPVDPYPLHLREAASRSNVFRFNDTGRLSDYRYVLFSCHGILPGETDRVTQPALILSHPDPDTGQDGYLTMADIFGIKFNADLINLSACNTGLGKIKKGEGMRGLTRAFMYAGTPAVSVTLWPVESKSTKTLSTGLYKNLKDGMSRAEALREIKLQMIRGEKGELFKHVFFWAPMVIFGDGN